MNATVIVDYQNIHLSAHEQFCSAGIPKHQSLIHPLHFAKEVIHARGEARVGDVDDASLTQVVVFRGLPSNLRQPAIYRRCLAQKSEWTRDPRVRVTYRSLRHRDGGLDHLQEVAGSQPTDGAHRPQGRALRAFRDRKVYS